MFIMSLKVKDYHRKGSVGIGNKCVKRRIYKMFDIFKNFITA